MSWDVQVVKFAQPACSPPARVPLGSFSEVQKHILAGLPELDDRVGSRLWGYRGLGFGIEFDFGTEDPVWHIGLHIVGLGDPISVLARFASPNGWVLIDCSDGERIRLEPASYEGWIAWQLFAYGQDPRVVKVGRRNGPRVLNLKYPPEPANAPLFAESIVQTAKKVTGVTLDYTLESLGSVETILDGFRADGETFQSVAETVFGFGCYVGEVTLRERGGIWVQAAEGPSGITDFPLAVQLSPPGGFIDPAGQVALRLEQGIAVGLLRWVKELKQTD